MLKVSTVFQYWIGTGWTQDIITKSNLKQAIRNKKQQCTTSEHVTWMWEIPIGNDKDDGNQDSDKNEWCDNGNWKVIIRVEARYNGCSVSGASNIV